MKIGLWTSPIFYFACNKNLTKKHEKSIIEESKNIRYRRFFRSIIKSKKKKVRNPTMTYVMSDIHGNYSAFQKMLKQINFTDDDLLYIAGDLVDYGADSMELLCDISMRANVYSVVGDHELEALKMLAGFSKML
jgi:hypothetical protein